MSPRLTILLIVLVAAFFAAFGAMFTVHQTQQALVLQFGEPRRVITEPGLHFKIPFIQNVSYYESRILELDPQGQDMSLVDQRRINVDAQSRPADFRTSPVRPEADQG